MQLLFGVGLHDAADDAESEGPGQITGFLHTHSGNDVSAAVECCRS